MELKEAQAISLETSVKSGEEWSLNEVQTLQAHRTNGLTYFAIAKAMGRSVYSVTTMARVMGIARTRAQKPAPKVQACEKCWLVHSYKECD